MVTPVTNDIFQFWLLAEVKPYLPHKDFERVINVFFFIMSWLEYCNFLYVGVDQSSVCCKKQQLKRKWSYNAILSSFTG